MLTTLPFVVCLFWLVFLLSEWKRVSHAVHMLSLFVGVCTMLYLCHALYFEGFVAVSRYSNTLYAFCNIAVFPLYYLYVCRLTQVGKITVRQWMVLVPAVIIGLWTAIDLFAFPGNEVLEMVRQITAKVVFFVQLVLVVCFGWRRIHVFNRRIMDFYSDAEGKVANMTSDMIIVLAVCSLISVIFSYIGREYFKDNAMTLYIPSVIFSVCLYAVCYIGYRQSFTADDMERDESALKEEKDILAEVAECEAGGGIDDGECGDEKVADNQSVTPLSLEFERVCNMIEEKRLYLRPDLRLPDLALLVGIGRTRLSTLINENSGMSFSDFINKYRVEYACNMLKETAADKELVLTAIGEQCGFMSDSPFYRNFKKVTGMTPAQYREKCRRGGIE